MNNGSRMDDYKDGIGGNILTFQMQVEKRDPLGMLMPETLKSPIINKMSKNTRKISKIPFKVLDAPALQDDFYLNLLDWSESNLLSVGLSSCVYLWSAANGKVFKVCDLGAEDMVTSVSWSKTGNFLGIGSNSGEVHIWDINKVKKIRTMEGHAGRVGTLAWGNNCLVSGSRDKTILLRDIRSPSNYTEKLYAHKQEVCG
jgi:cell division cycle 20-like protein 1 (cofactor of APC complex)